MRRFWAHIIIAATTLLLVGTTFFSLFTRTNMNQQYTDGYEITYRITDKDDETVEFDNKDAVNEIAGIMQTRLDSINITQYEIQTIGNDIIKVKFVEQESSVSKQNIIAYLGFNGSLALSNIDTDDNEYYAHITGKEFLLENSKVYLDDINYYPTIVIPVDKTNPYFENLVNQTKAQAEAGIGEDEKTGNKDDQGNDELKTMTYLYLWYDFDERYDSYSGTIDSVEMSRKIIMKFDINNLFYPDGKEDKLAYTVNLSSGEDGKISTKTIKDAYDTARFYANLLNSEELDYKVTQINAYVNNSIDASVEKYVSTADATIESLVVNSDPHQYVVMSRTMIAAIIAIALISLILVFYFRVNAITIASSALLSLFTSIALMIFMNAEFNIAALIALTAVALVSLAGNIYFASKMKDECYRGRTLKKATSEASRKSLLLNVDIHLVLIASGVFAYLFGGSLMKTFALIAVIGGLASLLISLIYSRINFWLIGNNTAFAKKMRYLGVDEELVVDTTAEEGEKKEAFRGPYEKINFNRHFKKFALGACSLLVATFVGLITFGALNNGNPFATKAPTTYSEVYIITENENETFDSVRNNVLNQITIYQENNAQQTLLDYVSSQETYKSVEYVGKEPEFTYYYEFKLNALLDENTQAEGFGSGRTNLKEVFEFYMSTNDKTKQASVKVADNVLYQSSANFGGIILGSVITIIVMSLYFMLRYKLSRGLAYLLATFSFSGFGIGLVALFRMPLPTFSAAFIPLFMIVASVIAIILMNKDKELVLEDKAREIDFQRRSEIMTEATSFSMTEISIFGGLSLLLSLIFLGFGPSATTLDYLMVMMSISLSLCFMVTLFGPIAQLLYSYLSPVENRRRKKGKKKNRNIVSATHRSKEPEEAIFIGIND